MLSHQQESLEVMLTGPRSHRDNNDIILGLNSLINDLKKTAAFINFLQGAILKQSNMKQEDIERLCAAEPDHLDVLDKHFFKSLHIFLLMKIALQATYDSVHSTLAECYPDDPFLSFWQMKQCIKQLSGVVPIFHHQEKCCYFIFLNLSFLCLFVLLLLLFCTFSSCLLKVNGLDFLKTKKMWKSTDIIPDDDMCPDTCARFTGSFINYDHCFICGKDHYWPSTCEPQWQFVTIPLGPVIQMLYGSPETADKMHYCEQTTADILEYARMHGGKLKEYNDTICGHDYLDAVEAGKIKKDDVLVQFSIDSTQLYNDKDSDCWIFVYIVYNLPPEICYKKRLVISAGFVPGPEKMKDGDLFIRPLLYHVSALQNEGLWIWDASTQSHIPHLIPFIFVTANSFAMAMVSGMVGHSGKFGCCLYCALPGRRREWDSHYYPVMLKPDAYGVLSCDHEDVTFSDLKQYQQGIPMCYHNNLRRLLWGWQSDAVQGLPLGHWTVQADYA